MLGGSGDALAYACARHGETIGAIVYRVPSFKLKNAREARSLEKKDDHKTLVELFTTSPEVFYEVASRDRALIRVTECWRALQEVMKARIACEQRLRQYFIGRVFTHPEGLFPEGGIEKAYDAQKASDPILEALLKEEKARDKDLKHALEALDVYTEIFEPIEGMGPRIAGRIISAVGDIRRFETPAKLCAFLGVHVLNDGTFPRRRGGSIANWHGDGRQALYLSFEQWNKRPDSYWGKYLRSMKTALRARHPEPVVIEEKGRMVRRYTDGHIHRMAGWRAMTRFVRRLWKDWYALEEGRAPLKKAA